MQKISFDHVFVPSSLPEHEYGYLVKETAKLLGMKYYPVHRMVEKWPISKIRDRLSEAQHHHGNLPPRVYWFWKRKREK